MSPSKVPICGRNFEYFSEDPYLCGELAKQYVETLQSRGIGATLKHFCCNNREFTRLYSSSNVDDRALREIYTKAFDIALEAKPWAVMCSYNAVNGTFVAENSYILKDLLRDELGFKGLLMSDWGAVRDRTLALKASLDLQMPYQDDSPYKSLKEGLKKGIVTEEDINTSINRLEELINKIQDSKKIRSVKYNDIERHQIAVETCRESIILLKNEENILPLKPARKIVIIGEHAEEPALGGGGSCNLGDHPELPFDERFNVKQRGLTSLLKEAMPDVEFQYICGYHFYKGFNEYGHVHTPVYIREAKNVETAIVVVGTNRTIECEGYDRESLDLPLVQIEVLEKVLDLYKNVILVVEAGGIVNLSKFKNKAKAILYSGFGGEGINEALADILLGKVSPSGKLTESYIDSMSINPYTPLRGDFVNEDYKDSIFVGYRLYDTRDIEVTYPFGFGLSYTKFKYSNLQITKTNEYDYKVSYDIENIGDMEGKEINQLYISGLNIDVPLPKKELKGFNKISLKPNEKKSITLYLNKDSFSHYDEKEHRWVIYPGIYQVLIGKSSKEIVLKEEIRF